MVDADRVDAGSLGELTIIGSGGQGTVYAVSDRLINDSWPAVYKEFEPSVQAVLDESALLAMVNFRRDLSEAMARRIDDVAAWPVAVVERAGRVCGFLMRRVPDPFMIGLRMSSGPVEHLAQVQLLLNDEAYLTGRGLIVDDRFRLELLSDVARSMEFFHGLDLVVGDLSPNNLLFSRDHRPRCFFVDCDAMRLGGASPLRPAETVDWQAPAGDARLATPASDSYKFGLLCVRLLAGDQSSRDPLALSRAGPAVAILAARALSADPRLRPTMAQWRAALDAAVAAPRIRAATGKRPHPVTRRTTAVAAVMLAAILLCLVPRLTGCTSWLRGVGGTLTGDSAQASEQASGVAQVLAAAGRTSDRVAAAVAQVDACTDVSVAADALHAGATSRLAVLERAKALRTDVLPAGGELKAQLVAALDHAGRADGDYARWAAAVERDGCRSAAAPAAARRQGDAELAVALVAKKRVAQLWNPVAARYGYPAASDRAV